MKLKTLVLTLVTAGLVASIAVASPPPGTGGDRKDAAGQEKAQVAKAKAAEARAAGKAKAAKAKAKAAKAKAARFAAKEEAEVLDGCKPRVSYILRGEFVSSSAGPEGTTLVTMLVKGGNAHAKRYAGKPAIVTIGDRTRMIRRGPAEASDLAAGDRLLVHVRGCKSADDAMALYAKHLVAKPAAADDEDDEDEDDDEDAATP